MSCQKLRNDLLLDCATPLRKYYQKVVLVNRADINNKNILVASVGIDDEYTCQHRVVFDLKEGKTGYMFSISENSESIFGEFDKTEVESVPQYAHSVSIVLLGISELVKCTMRQLDSGDYFAALKSQNGTIEIYGFEYGLTTAGYKYSPQSSAGGGVIRLISSPEAPEDEPPFLYGGNPADFDNKFSDVVYNPAGDFNDDFNDDFNNQD